MHDSELVDANRYRKNKTKAEAGKSLSYPGTYIDPVTGLATTAQVKQSSYDKGGFRRINDPDKSDLVAETMTAMVIDGIIPHNRKLPVATNIKKGVTDKQILEWGKIELIRKTAASIINSFEPGTESQAQARELARAVINDIRAGKLDKEILKAIKTPKTGIPILNEALKSYIAKNNYKVGAAIEEAVYAMIADNITNKFGQPELTPKMHFLAKTMKSNFGSAKQHLQASSDYLNSGNDRYFGCTPDELVARKAAYEHSYIMRLKSRLKGILSVFKRDKDKPQEKLKLRNGHAFLAASDKGARTLVYDEHFTIKIDNTPVKVYVNKKDLMRQMKLSMLVGDHDVNPGNMYFVYDKLTGECRMGRIDFGHALNDLIKDIMGNHAPKMAAGRGGVLDAINRLNVNDWRNKPTKLRQSYRGMVLDIDFANVLREKIDEQALDNNLKKTQQALLNIFQNGDEYIKAELRSALKTACIRMGDPLLDHEKINDELLVKAIISRMRNFVIANQKDAEKVADRIEIQALIEKIATGKATALEKEEIATRIAVLQHNNPELNTKIEWVRRDGETAIFTGTLNEYIDRIKAKSPETQNELEYLKLNIAKQKIKQGDSMAKKAVIAPERRTRQEVAEGDDIFTRHKQKDIFKDGNVTSKPVRKSEDTKSTDPKSYAKKYAKGHTSPNTEGFVKKVKKEGSHRSMKDKYHNSRKKASPGDSIGIT